MGLSRWCSDGQSVGVEISDIEHNTELAGYHPKIQASFSVRTEQVNETQIKMFPTDANGTGKGSWSPLAIELMEKLLFEEFTEDGQTFLKAVNVKDCHDDEATFNLVEWKIFKQRYVDKFQNEYDNAFVDKLLWNIEVDGQIKIHKSEWTWTRVNPH